jgi:hypothetical protein
VDRSGGMPIGDLERNRLLYLSIPWLFWANTIGLLVVLVALAVLRSRAWWLGILLGLWSLLQSIQFKRFVRAVFRD